MVAKKKVVVALDKRAAGAARTATHVSGRGPVDASPIDRFMAEVRLFMLNSAGAMAEVRDRLESLEYGAGPGKHERSESFAKRGDDTVDASREEMLSALDGRIRERLDRVGERLAGVKSNMCGVATPVAEIHGVLMQHEQRLSAAIGMLDTLSARLSPVLGLSSVAVNAAAECCPETPLGIRIHDSTGCKSEPAMLYTMQQAIDRIVGGLVLEWVEKGVDHDTRREYIATGTNGSYRVIRFSDRVVACLPTGNELCASVDYGKQLCVSFDRALFRAEIEKAVKL